MGISTGGLMIVDRIFDTINHHETEKTNRLKIEKQAEVILAAIKADFQKFQLSFEALRQERFQIISAVVLRLEKENLSEWDLRAVNILFDYLANPNVSYASLTTGASSGNLIGSYGNGQMLLARDED